VAVLAGFPRVMTDAVMRLLFANSGFPNVCDLIALKKCCDFLKLKLGALSHHIRRICLLLKEIRSNHIILSLLRKTERKPNTTSHH
jgi:hypothetical protein